MELPQELRAALERACERVPVRALSARSQELTRRYKQDSGSGLSLVRRDEDALVYALVRMPATFGAVAAALGHALDALPGLIPRTMLDAGAGVGTAYWAARSALSEAGHGLEGTLVEREGAMLELGRALMREAGLSGASWVQADMNAWRAQGTYDLVVASYMLNELEPSARDALLDRLWAATSGLMLIVEPGTPECAGQLRRARERLLAQGGHMVAPCPHEGACPLDEGDWCHFTCRVARSKLHRLIKGADAPYEDEKYCYMAFARAPAARCAYRVLRRPVSRSGQVALEVCSAQGAREKLLITRREGERFRAARKAECGSAL